MSSVSRIGGAALGLALLVVLTGCPGGGDHAGDDGAGRAPIILITVDGLIADELSAFGGPKATPALERLVSGGHAWTDGWTVCPMTRPAVASYLTGLAPDRHGVRDDLFTPLPREIPTLATLLSAQGYRTAAFPGSSPLGPSSGLLAGFEVVDDVPMIPVSPARWLPTAVGSAALADHFGAWLDTVPEDESFFAWLHFSHPMIGRIVEATAVPVEGDPDAEPVALQDDAPDVTDVDAALARVLKTLDARGELSDSLIIVAGTVGDVSGGEHDAPGPGFSLSEASLRIPVIASFPPGVDIGRTPEERLWAPDVTATVARVAGVDLPDASEGLSLTESAPSDRVLFAWSWATLDQARWRPLRAARLGSLVRREGYADGNSILGTDDPVEDNADTERLALELAARAEPAALAVDLDEVRTMLEGQGLNLDPLPAGGRDFDDAETRRSVAERLWRARVTVGAGKTQLALQMFNRTVRDDSENVGVLLDFGQVGVLSGGPRALNTLGLAVELAPTDPEVLHWYAHAVWSDRELAVGLLELVLPHKHMDGDVLYDLACARSLSGDIPSSERFLRSSLEAGFRNWSLIESDSDLRNLRESGRFSEVLREYGR